MNIIKFEIDIFMILETKIDNSFPISQFTMAVYSIPFRYDWKSRGDEILLKPTVMLILRGFLWR